MTGSRCRSASSRRQAEPTADYISVERNFTEVCVFARPLAELAAPPRMRHYAATSTTTVAHLMLTDLRLSHHTFVHQFYRVSLTYPIKVRGGMFVVVCCHCFPLPGPIMG